MPQNDKKTPQNEKKETPQNLHDMLQVNQPISLSMNRGQAIMILKGLESLPNSDKQSIVYTSLKKDLESIVMIWDRRIKNEQIVRADKAAAKKVSDQQKAMDGQALTQRMRVEQEQKKDETL